MQTNRVYPAEYWYDIHLRYQDTALVVFKEQLAQGPTNYLSFGKNRKAQIIHNHGNHAVIVHHRDRSNISLDQALKTSAKPASSQVMEVEQILNASRGAETTSPGQWYSLAISGGKPEPRVGHTATYLPHRKKVILIGGASPCALYNEVWQVDLVRLSASLLTLQGDHMQARYEHCAFAAPPSQDAEEVADKVRVFAGANMEGNLNDLWELNLSSDEWRKILCSGDVPTPRTMHTTSAVVNGHLQLFGGGCQAASPVVDDKVYQLDNETLVWTTLATQGTPPTSRQGHILVGCNGKLFCHGGMAGNKFFGDLHVLADGEWSVVPDTEQQPSARAGHGAVSLDKHIFIFGGLGPDGSLNDMWKLNTETLLWEEMRFESSTPRPKPRLDFAMCLVWLPPRFTPSFTNGEAVTHNGAQSEDLNSPESEQDLPFIFLHGGMDDLGTIYDDFHVFRLDDTSD